MQESIVFLVRVQCRRKESSRSLSHLLMSFLFVFLLKSEIDFVQHLTVAAICFKKLGVWRHQQFREYLTEFCVEELTTLPVFTAPEQG